MTWKLKSTTSGTPATAIDTGLPTRDRDQRDGRADQCYRDTEPEGPHLPIIRRRNALRPGQVRPAVPPRQAPAPSSARTRASESACSIAHPHVPSAPLAAHAKDEPAILRPRVGDVGPPPVPAAPRMLEGDASDVLAQDRARHRDDDPRHAHHAHRLERHHRPKRHKQERRLPVARQGPPGCRRARASRTARLRRRPRASDAMRTPRRNEGDA